MISKIGIPRLVLAFTLVFLLSGSVKAQERLLLPGQELLNPYLLDASYTGEERRTQFTAIGQAMDFDTERSSLYLNAQLPIYDNVSFGLDYFKNRLDFYNYDQVLLSAAFEIPFESGHLKIGLSGGGESLQLNRLPIGEQTPETIPDINETNIEFSYRVGLHYTWRRLSLGGYYTNLPLQEFRNTVQPEGNSAPEQDDILNYSIQQGITGYLGYNIPLKEKLYLSPSVRYSDFGDLTIPEARLNLEYDDKVDAGVSYRDAYSATAALRIRFFSTLGLSYSYAKALGDAPFEDIHAIGLSYRFKKAGADEEPEWMGRAKDNIEKIDDIQSKKVKGNKRSKKGERKQKESKSSESIPNTGKVATADRPDIGNEASGSKNPVNDKSSISDKAPPTAVIMSGEEDGSTDSVPTNGAVKQDVKDDNGRTVQVPVSRPVSIVMNPRFYIVVDKFDDYSKAYALRTRLLQEGQNSLIGSPENDARYYVYVDSDSDKTTALKKLDDYRQKKLTADVSLLAVE